MNRSILSELLAKIPVKFEQFIPGCGGIPMTAFASSPRFLKGGLVLIHSASLAIQRIIVLSRPPDMLTVIARVFIEVNASSLDSSGI